MEPVSEPSTGVLMSLTLRKFKVLGTSWSYFQNSGLTFLGAGLSNGNKRWAGVAILKPGLISHGSRCSSVPFDQIIHKCHLINLEMILPLSQVTE